MEKKQASPVGDFVKESILGGAIVSPVVDIAFKAFRKVPLKQAFKESYSTAQGWKRNAKWGLILGAVGVGVNALIGSYKKQPEAAPIAAPTLVEPTPVLEQAPQAGNFAQKETARREEAAEQSAQIG